MWLDTQSSSGSKSPILSSVHQLTSSAHCHKHIISQCSAIWKLPKLPNSGMVSEGIGGGDIQEQREVREGGEKVERSPRAAVESRNPLRSYPKEDEHLLRCCWWMPIVLRYHGSPFWHCSSPDVPGSLGLGCLSVDLSSMKLKPTSRN